MLLSQFLGAESEAYGVTLLGLYSQWAASAASPILGQLLVLLPRNDAFEAVLGTGRTFCGINFESSNR